MNKELFFYSTKCMYSKDAYSLIMKIGKENFEFVNVEMNNDIPHQVDRVPCIQKGGHFMFEDELFEYLKMRIDITPFMINEMGSKISDKYSYMDESGVNLDHNFLFLNKDFRIITPTTDSDNNRIIDYEKFLAQRDNDLKLMAR